MWDQLRMESYGFCCKMRVITAVSLLGWSGIIISIMAIIKLPFINSLATTSIIDLIDKTGMIIPVIFLILNIILIKRNSARNFTGVRSVIRIICIFFLSLYLITILSSQLFSIWFKTLLYSQNGIPDLRGIYAFISQLLIPLISCVLVERGKIDGLSIGLIVLLLISCYPILMFSLHQVNEGAIEIVKFLLGPLRIFFHCLAIHGFRKNRKRFINANIIFSMVLVMTNIVLSIVDGVTVPVIIYYYFYHICYSVVLYNIMEVNVENYKTLHRSQKCHSNHIIYVNVENDQETKQSV